MVEKEITMSYYQSYSRRYPPMHATRPTPTNVPTEVVDAYKAAYPDVAAWLDTALKRGNDFAGSLNAQLNRKGKLTPGQIEAVRKCIVRDRQRVVENRVIAENAPMVSVDALATAFASAKEAGLKYPKLTFAGFTFSPAGERSSNPGAIYVKDRDNGEYLGKVAGGRFIRTRSTPASVEQEVAAVVADPYNAAIAYGKQFGVCCCCNRDLTDAKSVAAGIGPVCKKRYFPNG